MRSFCSVRGLVAVTSFLISASWYTRTAHAQGFSLGGLTRVPTPAPVSSGKVVNATYTYFLYTAHDNLDEALGEVHAYVKTNFEDSLDDIDDDEVMLVSIVDTLVEECGEQGQLPQTLQPAWYNSSFSVCGKYTTVIKVQLARTWDEFIFRRTTLSVIRNYVQNWNSVPRSSFVRFIDPIQIKTEFNILLVNTRQLMTIYEYSFLGDTMEVSLRTRGLSNENPPFTITEIEYLWQKIVQRDETKDGNNGGGVRVRQLQGDSAPVTSNQVQMLVMAECATEACTAENLDIFLENIVPEIEDVILGNLQSWSETNYFDTVDEIAVNDEQDPLLVDEPDLPPESDYRTSGIQEEKAPLWLWFAFLVAAGVLIFACVWVFFCLGARDFQAARKLRQERKEKDADKKKKKKKKKTREPAPETMEQPAAASPQAPDAPPFADEESVDPDPVPRSPIAQRYFMKKTPPTPMPPAEDDGEDEFDISESNHDPEIQEIPPASLSSPTDDGEKPKKKKKKKTADGSKSPTKKKKKKKAHVAVDDQSLD